MRSYEQARGPLGVWDIGWAEAGWGRGERLGGRIGTLGVCGEPPVTRQRAPEHLNSWSSKQVWARWAKQ